MPNKRGGQNKKYNAENAEIVISMLSEGKSLAECSEAVHITVNTLQRWRLDNPSFDNDCIRALTLGYEVQADSLQTIPDTYDDINRARLKSDNLKWLLARRAAHKYGDRIDINVTQTVDLKAVLAEADKRALLPSRDLGLVVDAEIVETKQLTDNRSTDNKSGMPQDGDASKIASGLKSTTIETKK